MHFNRLLLLTIPAVAFCQAPAQTDCANGSDAECQQAIVGAMGSLPAARAARSVSPLGRAKPAATDGHRPKDEHAEIVAPAAAAVDPPTEFQRFAEASTGTKLSLYGSDLFRAEPTGFAPVERQGVTSDYRPGPGDELLLRVWGQVNLNLELTVDRTGAIYIPQVGSVTVSGVSYRELPDLLRGQMARVFRNFELNVTMGQLKSIQVFVVGQARRPGTYTVSSMSTLVNAIFACGGPNAQGTMRRIALKRDNTVISEFDLYGLIMDGDKSADRKLSAGDVIYFPSAGPQIAIAGSVRNPAVFELKGPETLSAAIRMAGGFSPVANRSMVKIERVNGDTRNVDDVMLDAAGLAAPVANGDVIRLLSVAPRFDREVTLRGNVASPGRFRWRPGLRIADIIPNKESLTTREYWERHNELGFTPVSGTAKDTAGDSTQILPIGPEINWTYAVIERRNSKDLSRQLVPFHLGKLVLERDPAENLELQPADVVTILTQDDLHVPVSQQSRFVRLEGEFKAPGIYEAKAGETLGQLVERTGGFTKDAYLYGAEFTRESVRRDQQERLEQAIRDMEREAAAETGRDRRMVGTPDSAAMVESTRRMAARLRGLRASGRIALTGNAASGDTAVAQTLMSIPLEDGDRFVAPPKPITVSVLGDVYNPGALLYDGKMRVQDYLRLAGGCTRAADRNRVFVIRADGTVVSKQSSGRFGPSFEMLHVKPGDTIVAPQTMPKASKLQGIRDWSQAVAQFGLGATAVGVLR